MAGRAVPIETMIGTGWDQLLAMLTVGGMVLTLTGTAAAVVASVLVLWLRYRLRSYFVMRSDYKALERLLETEHRENRERIEAVEEKMAKLATKHSLTGIEQRQESLNSRVSQLQADIRGVSSDISGLGRSNEKVEHMMSLVLQHLLQTSERSA